MKVMLVQKKAIEVIADFLPAHEREGFISGGIPEVETPAQLQVRLNGKETERAVINPFDFRRVFPTPHHSTADILKRLAQQLDVVTGLSQRRDIGLVSLFQALLGVVEEIAVFRGAWRGGLL